MQITRSKICFLSGNALKIIAAISMLIDHAGLMFFPDSDILRIIGRLAFPIFAFMIAEGCRHTRNRLRYFLSVLLMGLAYSAVYYVYSRKIYFCILITFALAIMLTFALAEFKNALFSSEASLLRKLLSFAAFAAALAVVFTLNAFFRIDYGIMGCLTPMLVSIVHSPKENAPKVFSVIDTLPFQLCGLTVGILGLFFIYGGLRIYALLALPLLLLYSGKRGKLKMKYFFYVFYPAHLLALEGIAALISLMR